MEEKLYYTLWLNKYPISNALTLPQIFIGIYCEK